ncbi:MAG: TrmH family RNA methyltransferase [Salinibacter sp.]
MGHHEVDAEQEMNRLIASGGTPPADKDPFQFGDTRLPPGRVIELLRPHMTDRRLRRLREVVAERTRTVVPVVEGLVNTGNVSAVMRSAEALGYQDVHVVKGDNERYKHSERTAGGAQRWLDVWRWEEAAAGAAHLREAGYRLVATHLHADTVPIRELNFTEPTALIFGNEEAGVSDAMMNEVDAACEVPLPGFTESFNVSVAAAVALYHAQQDRLDRQGHHADLGAEEQERLVARFCLRSVTEPEQIIERKLADAT